MRRLIPQCRICGPRCCKIERSPRRTPVGVGAGGPCPAVDDCFFRDPLCGDAAAVLRASAGDQYVAGAPPAYRQAGGRLTWATPSRPSSPCRRSPYPWSLVLPPRARAARHDGAFLRAWPCPALSLSLGPPSPPGSTFSASRSPVAIGIEVAGVQASQGRGSRRSVHEPQHLLQFCQLLEHQGSATGSVHVCKSYEQQMAPCSEYANVTKHSNKSEEIRMFMLINCC